MWLTLVLVGLTVVSVESVGSSANKPIPGTITPFLNQTSVGVYRFKGSKVNDLVFHSYWYQDNMAEKLALGIGTRGKDLQAHFWFFKHVAYELKPKDSQDQSKGYICEKFVDFNYSMEVGGYDHRYLQTLGEYTVKEANETFDAEFFLGVALDGVGPLNVLCVLDKKDGTYAKMYTTQAIGFAAYSEYYLYPRNDSVPGDEYFELADECKQPGIHEVKFFDTFDMNGKKIKKDEKHCPTCPPPTECNSGAMLIPSIVLVTLLSFINIYS